MKKKRIRITLIRTSKKEMSTITNTVKVGDVIWGYIFEVPSDKLIWSELKLVRFNENNNSRHKNMEIAFTTVENKINRVYKEMLGSM